MMMKFIALIPFVLSVSIGLIPTIVYFDKFVELISVNYKEYWIKMGSPVGILWRPLEINSAISSSQATLYVSLLWLFNRPVLISEDLIAMGFLSKFRRHFFIWLVGFFITFLTFVYSLRYFPVQQ